MGPFDKTKYQREYMRERRAEKHVEEFVKVYLTRGKSRPLEEPLPDKEQLTDALAFFQNGYPELGIYPNCLKQLKVLNCKLSENAESSNLMLFYEYAAFHDLLLGMLKLAHNLSEKIAPQLERAVHYKDIASNVGKAPSPVGGAVTRLEQSKFDTAWKLSGHSDGITETVNALDLTDFSRNLCVVVQWIETVGKKYKEHFNNVQARKESREVELKEAETKRALKRAGIDPSKLKPGEVIVWK